MKIDLRRSARSLLILGLVTLGTCDWGSPNGLIVAQQAAVAQAATASDELKIVVVAGEDAVNIVKKKTAVQPVVEVRDTNNLPVAGATVTFTLPSTGASGTFVGGAHTMTLLTNASGRAAVAGLHPVGTGAFHIAVSASFQGHIATAAIAQTNYLTAAAAASAGAGGGAGGGGAGAAGAGAGAGAGGGLSTGVIAGIVAGVAAAAAAGAAVGLSGGKKSPPPAANTTIGLGTATVNP